ncbi:MAG: DNA-binding protein [Candidatus Schekmanbacteria bacterium]|nr:DNA-binding protein [Candidatus Schekmanbacteria bacterium]
MKYSQARQGRVFVIRLETGDVIHEAIERLAFEQGISCASFIIVGGVDKDSTLIVGPAERELNSPAISYVLQQPHEITGSGTLFPNEAGKPVVHMHIACGRNDSTITGCIRKGVNTWNLLEIVLIELIGCRAKRVLDAKSGLMLLQP